MNASRRRFLQETILSAGAFGAWPLSAAAPPLRPPGFLTRASPMKLGMVTYQLGQEWDLGTILRNCEAAQFDGVELRTGHAHKVEVNLAPDQREEVRKRFMDSRVQLMGLGSAFDFHTPDPEKLKKDIAATKAYIVLAHDVGARGVKVRPNGLPKDVPREKTLEQIGRSLRELGHYGDQFGIAIRLEVHGAGTSLLPNIRAILDAADHANVGVCWNSNQTDLDGEGFDHNFNLLKKKIFTVHMRDLFLDEYPFRKLLTGLNEAGFMGYCLAEIPESNDPVRVLKYFRSLWLAYQNLL